MSNVRKTAGCVGGVLGVIPGGFIGLVAGIYWGDSLGYTGGSSIVAMMMGVAGAIVGAIVLPAVLYHVIRGKSRPSPDLDRDPLE
jgi:hypothetical protein